LYKLHGFYGFVLWICKRLYKFKISRAFGNNKIMTIEYQFFIELFN